jgi:hypothetical protein
MPWMLAVDLTDLFRIIPVDIIGDEYYPIRFNLNM